MIDFDDGERLLDLIGLGLGVLIVFAIVVLVLAATSAGPRAAQVPNATWTVRRTNASYVRITHLGGDPVRASALSVTVDGTPRHVTWSAATLTDGEYGLVRVDDGRTVTLLWRHVETKQDVLGEWRLPKPSDTRTDRRRPARV